VGLTAATYLSAAATYCLLAFKPLKYARTVLVQLAAMFVNRLLPGGIGALGSNFVYLRREGHNSTQAGSMVAINNLLGFAGHSLLLLIILLAYSGHLPAARHMQGRSGFWAGVGIALLAAVLLVLLIRPARQRVTTWGTEVGRQLSTYRQRPWRLPAALLSSMTLTLANVGCLAACAEALGVHLSFLTIFLVFSLGISAGTATPTPGGLGGFEAGLVAGMVAYDVNSAAALAVALLYRLISYWLALLAGGIAFIVCQRRGLLTL
jgi:uncharacterized membrane protein YbhN (UPF0104 family)